MKFSKIYRYLKPFWKKEILVLFLSGLVAALQLVNPYLAKLVIEKAYGNKDLRLFVGLVALGGIIFLINISINSFSLYLTRSIYLRLKFALNLKIFRKLHTLPYRLFQDTTVGENLYKISYDIEEFSRFVSDFLPKMTSLIVKSLIIVTVIFYLNKPLALFILPFTPLFYIFSFYFSRRLKRAYKNFTDNCELIYRKTQEIFSNMRLVRAFGKERKEVRGHVKKLARNFRMDLHVLRLEMTNVFVNNLINRIASGIVIIYGGFQMIKGEITLGSLTAIALFLTQLSGIQDLFVNLHQEASQGSVSCERLERILDLESEAPREDKNLKEAVFTRGDIEFKNVKFGYLDKPVFDRLNFFVPGGRHIALVGSLGSGKTTISNLILRLCRPLDGEVLIDGYEVNSLRPEPFYRQVGIVLQESIIWNDTVENNIRYSMEEADFRDVAEVSRVACVDSFVEGLPRGYATVVGENAYRISEGQKQLIAVARAAIKKPRILILDEALSSVDTRIEGMVIDNLKEWLAESTIIVISHRVSAIEKMDLVYFLQGYSKISFGLHKELLRENTYYQNYLACSLKEEIARLEVSC